MNHSVTMSDIARELGVSTVTVSKALGDKEGVSDAVREKVKEKAEQMGYRYHSLAGGMKEGISGNVGVLVSEGFFQDNAFYARLYNRNVQDLKRLGYSCILEILTKLDEREGILPKMIENNKIDALIILGQLKRSYISKIRAINIPFLFQDFYDEDYNVDSVVSDNVYGAYQLTNYLITSGFEKIGFIGNIYATSSIMDRYLGYYRAMLQNRIPLREEWIISDRDETIGTYTTLELPEELPDAFFCNCDEVAYSLVKQLQAAGKRVPEDISVIGFDDSSFATFCNPGLTTYRVAIETMSETAVDAVTKKIKDAEYRIGRKVIGGDIVIRDSVKPKL
ncbi:MAG: LacI family DNA-binding transcriptional regulator [Lachnospiraceae bacterium]|nr:LacI family DNA-binding transcriptional regulator [Lachnospiraceae bacterium]